MPSVKFWATSASWFNCLYHAAIMIVLSIRRILNHMHVVEGSSRLANLLMFLILEWVSCECHSLGILNLYSWYFLLLGLPQIVQLCWPLTLVCFILLLGSLQRKTVDWSLLRSILRFHGSFSSWFLAYSCCHWRFS